MDKPGNILRIDLTSGNITVEEIPVAIRRKYIGGEGINDWLLWEHFLAVDPHIDPLGPENVLVIGTGLLDGYGYGVGGRVKWTFKSPITGIFGDSSSGGRFGATLKNAGFDHLVITGKAEKPVYINIDDDRVSIEDASHIWGKDVIESDRIIKQSIGDSLVDTALIGAAGENQVTYSCVMVTVHRSAGRSGGGAVMGSKNLKGFAVRGTKGVHVHDTAALFKAKDAFIDMLSNNSGTFDNFRRNGTTFLTEWYNRIGINSLHNNQHCILPDDQKKLLNHKFVNHNLAVSPRGCAGCIVGCTSTTEIKGTESPAAERYKGEKWTRPEYGGMAGLGIMTGVIDWPAVCHFWYMTDYYSMDCIELGACISFMMELWQRKIITADDVREWMGEPLSLDWGNVEAVEKMIDAAALQQNEMGRLLSRGVYWAAEEIERIKQVPVRQYAVYGKGGAAFIEDVRNTASWAVNMAVASRGADHLKGSGTLDKVNSPAMSEFYFGTPDVARPNTTFMKGASSAVAEDRNAMINALGLCSFTIVSPIKFSKEMFAEAVRATTGLDVSGDDLLDAGKRINNLEKAFNSRLGLGREDDKLCHRWLKEPMPDGPGKGWKAEDYLEELKSEYYEWHGWDGTSSLQKRETLEDLDMAEIANVLQQENVLAKPGS